VGEPVSTAFGLRKSPYRDEVDREYDPDLLPREIVTEVAYGIAISPAGGNLKAI
jgi:hypothetical protein